MYGIYCNNYGLWSGCKIDWAGINEHTDTFQTKERAEKFLKDYAECYSGLSITIRRIPEQTSDD